MFTKPLSEVEYGDIERFCQTFSEGVRVEYKSQMIDNFPKTISAFANTLGGFILIGAETDKTSNRVTSINGIDKESGIEEKIINSSLQGIYPAVLPEVRIFDIPKKKDRILVVIKVHEGVEAPHAIQNSTRIYIRTGSVSHPYDLAEVDRIEYLLQRRAKQQKRKEQLKQDARNRIEKFSNGVRTVQPFIEVCVSPIFPYQPLISLDELHVFGEKVPYFSPQRITGGICKVYGNQNEFSYKEINHYGLVFTRDVLSKAKSQWRSVANQINEEKVFLIFTHMVLDIIKPLKLAESFYKTCGYIGNLEVEVNLQNIANEYLMYIDNGFDMFNENKALDNSLYSSERIVPVDITSKLSTIIVSLTKNILWNFNLPGNTDLTKRIEAILKDNRF
jgi:hypothetical protein